MVHVVVIYPLQRIHFFRMAVMVNVAEGLVFIIWKYLMMTLNLFIDLFGKTKTIITIAAIYRPPIQPIVNVMNSFW